MLTLLTAKAEISKAMAQLAVTLCRGTEKYMTTIGGPGFSEKVDTYWHPTMDLWLHLGKGHNRFWNCFGLGKPDKVMPVIVEINPPHSDVNRRCAGGFLRDSAGRVYLAHSGKVGGGRKGVGKEAFSNFYVGTRQTVVLPNQDTTEMLVLGRVNDTKLPARIALFVREVDRFKNAVVAGTVTLGKSSFTPEFGGKRKLYNPPNEIESQCDHGFVVNALKERVEALWPDAHFSNKDRRDLYAVDGAFTTLFEVKTDTSTTSIYTAVGQLMLHGHLEKPVPQLVLVVPESLNKRTRRVIRRLKIRTVKYTWVDDSVGFVGLERLRT